MENDCTNEMAKQLLSCYLLLFSMLGRLDQSQSFVITGKEFAGTGTDVTYL